MFETREMYHIMKRKAQSLTNRLHKQQMAHANMLHCLHCYIDKKVLKISLSYVKV